MRNIKFRAWNKQTKTMGYLDYIWNDHWYSNPTGEKDLGTAVWDNSNIVFPGGWEHKFELMQFTGLKDSDGKEIYEGDLVKSHTGRICEIRWFEGNGMWDTTAVNDEGVPFPFQSIQGSGKYKVIGNIYEKAI